MSELPSLSPTPPPLPRAARRAGRMLLLLAVIAAAWGLWSRFTAQRALASERDADNVVSVSVVTPQASGDADRLVLPASVTAWSSAPIYARGSGYVKRWRVDIGARVKAGELLAELESPEVDQALRQAQADLATDEANAHLAQVTAERWKALAKIEMVSRQDVDEKVGDAEAKAAMLASARANLQRLRELQSFERITAPFDGVITARNAEVGMLVTAGTGGQELFHLEDTRRLRVYVQVPEAYASTIKVGDAAELRAVQSSSQPLAAQVSHTADALDPQTRTLQVQLSVDNAGDRLLPGAYAEVAFSSKGAVAARRIPATALLFRAEGPMVAVAGLDGRARLQRVDIGRDFGAQLEIVGGLHASDRVIVNPPDGIRDGEQLQVIPGGSDKT